MKRWNCLKPSELVYLVSFALYIIYRVMTNSLIPAPTFLRYAIIALLVMSFLLQQKISTKRLLFIVVLTALAVAILISRESFTNALLCILLIAFSGSYNLNDIMITELIVLTLSYLSITSLSVLGFLQDRLYSHSIASSSQAHTYGFNYYGFPAGAVMTIIILYLNTRKRRVSWFTLALLCGIQLIASNIYTARLYTGILLIYIIAYIAVEKFDFFDLQKTRYKIVALTSYPLGLIVSFLATFFYNSRDSMMVEINRMLSGRLQMASSLFKVYGYSLLGKSIVQYTTVDRVYGGYRGQMTMVDFGFINCALNNGFVTVVIITLIYTICFYWVWKHKNKKLYIWMLIALCMNMINNNLTEILFNPFLLAISEVVPFGKKSSMRAEK